METASTRALLQLHRMSIDVEVLAVLNGLMYTSAQGVSLSCVASKCMKFSYILSAVRSLVEVRSKASVAAPSFILNTCLIDLAKHVLPHWEVHAGEDGVENENCFCGNAEGLACSRFANDGACAFGRLKSSLVIANSHVYVTSPSIRSQGGMVGEQVPGRISTALEGALRIALTILFKLFLVASSNTNVNPY